MGECILDSCLHDQRQSQQTYQIWCETVKGAKSMMYKFSTVRVTWAHSTDLDRAHAVTMAGSQVVNVHSAEGVEYLNDKGLPRIIVSAFVNDQSKVVDLQDHAEVNHGTHLSSDHHGSFGEMKAASD